MQFINYGILQESGITSPLWIYKDGDECTSITGGWEEGLDGSYYGNNMKYSTYMVADIRASGDCSWVTTNPIDVTDYNELVIKWRGTCEGGIESHTVNLHTSKTQGFSSNALVTKTSPFSQITDSYDISSYSGSRYIAFHARVYNASSGDHTMTYMYQLSLEV